MVIYLPIPTYVIEITIMRKKIHISQKGNRSYIERL